MSVERPHADERTLKIPGGTARVIRSVMDEREKAAAPLSNQKGCPLSRSNWALGESLD